MQITGNVSSSRDINVADDHSSITIAYDGQDIPAQILQEVEHTVPDKEHQREVLMLLSEMQGGMQAHTPTPIENAFKRIVKLTPKVARILLETWQSPLTTAGVVVQTLWNYLSAAEESSDQS